MSTLRTTPSPLEYAARNLYTGGDPFLEELRQAAVGEFESLQNELNDLRARLCIPPKQLRLSLASAQLYRGVFIYTLPDGRALVFGEDGREYGCLNLAEAQAFIDASLELSGLLIGALV